MNGIRMIGQNIYHRRGDTGVIRVNMYQIHRYRSGDTATLTIKKHLRDEKPILQKETDSGYFAMTHEDTSKIPYGVYWYDIKLKLSEEQYFTVAGPAQYHLLPDVMN